MNFFNSKIVKGDGKLFVDGESFRVEVPSSKVKTYMPYEGKAVSMGIRPEDIHHPSYIPPEIFSQPVEGTIDVTELMGNEIFLYVTTGVHNFVARVDPRSRVSMGDRSQVLFNMNNMHLFDLDTEQAIR
jgi:multiple sugar transport system ATP-binding protein